MQQDLEELHRQASGHYLKGEFPAAIEAWKAVLDRQPDDERAREGIRLCEQLAGGFDPEAAPPPAEEASPPPPADEELALDLTQIEAPPPPATDLVAAPPPVTAPAAEPGQIDTAAADELRRRTEALLYEAQQQYELGKADDAIKTIGRVLILDDENADALALKERIEAERAAEPQPAAAGPPSKGSAAGPPSEGSAADALPALDLEADLQASPEAADPTGPSIPGFSATHEGVPQDFLAEPPPLANPTESPVDAPVAAEPQPEGDAAPVKPKQSLPPWLQDRRIVLGLVGGTLALVAFAFVRMSGGGAPPPDPVTVADTPQQVAEPAEAAPEPAVEASGQPTAPPQDAQALMRQAQQAFDAEDYAGAMVAYDTILEQTPGHAEATAKLKVAVERYREQQERKKRWDDAVAAFEEGNYAMALRSFYRMPEDEYTADLDRNKVNGWYNIGVLALQANDCNRAIENLEEALRVDPADEGVLTALDLAELCEGAAVKEDIRNLSLRGLND